MEELITTYSVTKGIELRLISCWDPAAVLQEIQRTREQGVLCPECAANKMQTVWRFSNALGFPTDEM